ncbi:MAG: hypothetical protein IIX36_07740 [Clostridia bacterium]|nr:hypothetical protein [Clostridia bacterium]
MLKKFITNTSSSFFTLILMSLIFTFGGFLVIDLFKSFAGVAMIALFGVILCIGYLIGRKLHYTKGIGFASIVLLPMVVFTVLFGLCIVGVPVISMLIQYPAAVWCEAFGNVRLADNNTVVFYGIALAHYLVCSLTLFAGAYVNRRKQGTVAVE